MMKLKSISPSTVKLEKNVKNNLNVLLAGLPLADKKVKKQADKMVRAVDNIVEKAHTMNVKRSREKKSNKIFKFAHSTTPQTAADLEEIFLDDVKVQSGSEEENVDYSSLNLEFQTYAEFEAQGLMENLIPSMTVNIPDNQFEEFVKASRSIEELSSKISPEALTDFTKQMDSFCKSISKLSESIDNGASSFSNGGNYIVNGLFSMSKNINKALMTVPITIVLSYLGIKVIKQVDDGVREGDKKLLIPVAVLAGIWLSTQIPQISSHIFDFIKGLFVFGKNNTKPLGVNDNVEEVNLESQAWESKDIGSLAAMVLSVVSFTSLGKTPVYTYLKSFKKECDIWVKGIRDVNTMEMAVSIFEKAINFVRVEILGLNAFDFISEAEGPIRNWLEKVDNLQKEAYDGKLKICTANASRIWNMKYEGIQLPRTYPIIFNSSVRVRDAYSRYMRVIENISKPFVALNTTDSGPRREPLTVLIVGNSGAGKSFLTIPLILKVLARVLPQKDAERLSNHWQEYVYCRQAETKYWDGYHGQEAAVFDDFGQCRDAVGMSDNEFMDIIRCSNMFPNTLHMAHLENKGNTHFISNVIIATSNLNSIQPNSIIEPEAVLRRFIKFRVSVKPEYSIDPKADKFNRMVDKRKVGDGSFNSDVYEFYGLDNEMRPNSEAISFDNLIDTLVQEYKLKSTIGDVYLSSLPKLVDDELTKRFGDSNLQPQMADDVEITQEWSLPKIGLAGIKNLNPRSNELLEKLASDFDAMEKPCLSKDKRRFSEWLHGKTNTWFSSPENTLTWLSKSELNTFIGYLVLKIAQYSEGQVWLKEDAALYLFSRRIGDTAWQEFLEKEPPLTVCLQFLDAIMKEDFLPHFTTEDVPHILCSRLDIEPARKEFDGYFETIKSNSKLFVDRYPDAARFLSYSVSAMAIAATIGMVMKLYNFTFTSTGTTTEPLRDELYDRDTRSHHARRKHRTKVDLPSISPQGCDDYNSEQISTKVIKGNTYNMYAGTCDDDMKPYGSLIFIGESLALIPNHFVSDLDLKQSRTTKPIFVQLEDQFLDKVKTLKFEEFSERYQTEKLKMHDLVLVRLPRQVGLHSHILKYFITEKDLDKIPGKIRGRLVVMREQFVDKHYGDMSLNEGVRVNSGDNGWVLSRVWQYRIPTCKGDCGSLLYVDNKYIGPGKIVGVHVAGDTKVSFGVASVVTQDMISEALQIGIEAQSGDDQLPFGGGFKLVRTVDKGISYPCVSSIVPSPLYNLIKTPLTLPAVLNNKIVDGRVVNPVYKAIEGYAVGKVSPGKDLLRICAQDIFSSMVNSDWSHRSCKVRSVEEAILGISGDPYSRPIPRNTSPGWPFVESKLLPGKSDWFGLGEIYDLSSAKFLELKGLVLNQENMLRNGLLPEYVFMDFPKDERRPIEKVTQIKTRLISGSPLDLTILCRMYFMDFTSWWSRLNLDIGSAIGINPYSIQWDMLHRNLQSKGPKVFAGDYSGFDKRHHPDFYEVVLDEIIQPYYDDGDTNYQVRKLLLRSMSHAKHIVGRYIYEMYGTLPSGNPLTAYLNTIFNKMILRGCFCLSHVDKDKAIGEYRKNVSDVALGDDHVVNVSDEASEHFNQHSMVVYAKEFGMVYTDEKKSGDEIPKTRLLSEVSFLKRSFRYESALGRIVAPLDLDVVLETPMWTKRGILGEVIAKSNVDFCLSELALHGKEVYDLWAPLVVKQSRQHLGHQPLTTDWMLLLQLAASREEQW